MICTLLCFYRKRIASALVGLAITAVAPCITAQTVTYSMLYKFPIFVEESAQSAQLIQAQYGNLYGFHI
jgi:hypothetical protein